jgi:hypothetical protein
MKIIALGLMAGLAVFVSAASAHGGRTNAEGCHNERATGSYHCHGRKAPPRKVDYLAADAQPASGGPAYRNCPAARAAGAAPVYRGEPGYGTHLDGDGDGVGCE